VRRAYLVGAWLAVRCWPLVAALWVVNVAFGAGFFVASSVWLNHALDDSLPTRTLLWDLDPNVFIDLYYRHDTGFLMLFGIACFMGPVYLLVWCWLHGGIIFQTYSKGRMRLADAFLRATEVFPRMLQLLVIAAVMLALLTGVVGGAAWCALAATLAYPSEIGWYWIGAAAGAVWLVGYVFLVAIHDHARIRTCASGEGAIRAYWWAVRFVIRGGEHALLLAVVLNVTALVVWAAFQAVSETLRPDKGLGMVGILVWGELFLFVRMVLRVWFFAAQGDLQSPA
jgi:hypothetical protein